MKNLGTQTEERLDARDLRKQFIERDLRQPCILRNRSRIQRLTTTTRLTTYTEVDDNLCIYVIGSAEPSARSQNRRTVTLKDMIAAYNGNCLQSHVDVVHNRLNPDDLQGDSLLRTTRYGILMVFQRADPRN
jgi:histone H3/H4